MKFSINQKTLNDILSITSKGVSPRSNMPALAGVYVEANENEVSIRSTNLELSVSVSAPALIEEDGSALLPAKLFSDIVSTFKDEAVSVSTTEENAEISCDKSNFNIRVMNATDFPPFPEVEATQTVMLPFKEFSSMVKKVAKMVSRDESRAILQGVNINYENGTLEMVATDAYRIAVAKKQMNIDGVENFNAVIPGAFLMDVAGLSGEISNAQVSLSQNQVVVTCNDIVFVNRRIEGNFPDYKQLLPEEKALTATLNNAELADAVRRISVLSAHSPVVKFTFDNTSGVVKLDGTAQDVGSCEESISCDFQDFNEEDTVLIAFNCHYVLEGLACVDTDKVKIEIAKDSARAVFYDESGQNLIYVLLPVRVA